jgi:hypothetical protein
VVRNGLDDHPIWSFDSVKAQEFMLADKSKRARQPADYIHMLWRQVMHDENGKNQTIRDNRMHVADQISSNYWVWRTASLDFPKNCNAPPAAPLRCLNNPTRAFRCLP